MLFSVMRGQLVAECIENRTISVVSPFFFVNLTSASIQHFYHNIGLRLLIGLIVAALIQVAVPDEFFLRFGHQPLLQMLVILAIAVPMYICSTGSIPVAAALMMKGLSPGAALVMLMAGPAVNLASILVVNKSMGRRFTAVYLLAILGFSILFGLIINALPLSASLFPLSSGEGACCGASVLPGPFKMICAVVLTLLILYALMMKLFSKFFGQKPADPDVTVYRVENMHCSHCEAAVVRAVENHKTTTDFENVQNNVRSEKVMENGVLYIIKNGVKYNAQGQIVK